MTNTGIQHAVIITVALIASACGDTAEKSDEPSNEESCRLDVGLSGAVELESSLGDFRCGFGVVGQNDFLAFFFGTANAGLDLFLGGSAGPNDVGAGLPASLTIEHSDGRTFDASMCRIEVLENTFVGSTSNWEEYHVEGTGTCSEPATSGTDEVTVAPFSFAVNVGFEPPVP
jgi:hypothetical protein